MRRVSGGAEAGAKKRKGGEGGAWRRSRALISGNRAHTQDEANINHETDTNNDSNNGNDENNNRNSNNNIGNNNNNNNN